MLINKGNSMCSLPLLEDFREYSFHIITESGIALMELTTGINPPEFATVGLLQALYLTSGDKGWDLSEVSTNGGIIAFDRWEIDPNNSLIFAIFGGTQVPEGQLKCREGRGYMFRTLLRFIRTVLSFFIGRGTLIELISKNKFESLKKQMQAHGNFLRWCIQQHANPVMLFKEPAYSHHTENSEILLDLLRGLRDQLQAPFSTIWSAGKLYSTCNGFQSLHHIQQLIIQLYMNYTLGTGHHSFEFPVFLQFSNEKLEEERYFIGMKVTNIVWVSTVLESERKSREFSEYISSEIGAVESISEEEVLKSEIEEEISPPILGWIYNNKKSHNLRFNVGKKTQELYELYVQMQEEPIPPELDCELESYVRKGGYILYMLYSHNMRILLLYPQEIGVQEIAKISQEVGRTMQEEFSNSIHILK